MKTRFTTQELYIIDIAARIHTDVHLSQNDDWRACNTYFCRVCRELVGLNTEPYATGNPRSRCG